MSRLNVDAVAYAADYPAEEQEFKKKFYLDSVSSEPVFDILITEYTFAECQQRELNLGLDLKGGMNVIDIGAAPGSWSQYVSKIVKSGKIVSVDLKEMEEIINTIQIKGDFTEESIQDEIKKHMSTKVNVVMSDMAVNTTGIKNIDSIQTGELCIEAMLFSKNLLKGNGFFISKIFMGGTFNEIVAEGKKYFKEVKVFKPKSSRKDSKESFIICRKLR